LLKEEFIMSDSTVKTYKGVGKKSIAKINGVWIANISKDEDIEITHQFIDVKSVNLEAEITKEWS